MEKPKGYIEANSLFEDMIDEIEAYWSSNSNIIFLKEINSSLDAIFKDYPKNEKLAFIVMQFGITPAHARIVEAIKSVLRRNDIVALRADDKEYHNDLYYNVLTYIYRCNFSICIFDRIESDQFNPNVALEVGYLLSLGKPICLLKDKTLKALPTDLVGKLYKEFDPQSPESDIEKELTKWLNDKSIIS
ncbi:MAG TPA: hypothetical protein VGD14_13680 [bacterium]